eukprot:TRINITY_DN13532_c0_g1_i1.p1 TRINITY_DN13532_c0_g1~~TRINITY_DN13532_c0_g1_i1.p1  ORF type:complete len:630 (+),score=206.02 TRINITY_DN13532_c0_g1_i1:104-1993(+)
MRDEEGIKLSSVGLFHLGQQNPSNINSFASVPGIGERPPLSFAAGCSALFVMAPRRRTAATGDAADTSKWGWKNVDTSDKSLHNSQILAIAATVCSSLPDTVWVMVGYAQVQAATRKPHISIIKFDRNDFNASDPQVKGSVTHTEPLDFWPITIKSYDCGDHTGFLIAGSDKEIHARMLVRHTVYNTFYEISNPLKLDKIVFLRHLINVKSVVLSMDFYLGQTYDLWATGCQDGWLQLWHIPESDAETKMASVLLNGPISSVCFFSVSPNGRHKRIKKTYEELAGVLHRAQEDAGVPDAADTSATAWDTCDNLLVAQASGRAIIFWNVGRHGLNCPDVLPSPPLDTEYAPGPGADVPRCPSDNQLMRPMNSASASSAPALSTPTSSRADRGEKSLRGALTPADGGAAAAVSCTSSPEASLDNTPCRRSPKLAEAKVDDGGLLGTGVLCVHASDVTGDGVSELLVGTYAKALIVYKLNRNPVDDGEAEDREAAPELGSLFDAKLECAPCPPWRYDVARVRFFPYQLHHIHTAECPAEATNALQILTAYHLHIVAPDARQVRQQVQERLQLIQQILELEQRCGDGRGADDGLRNKDDDDTQSSSSSSSLPQDQARDEPCPTWIMDRFQLGR